MKSSYAIWFSDDSYTDIQSQLFNVQAELIGQKDAINSAAAQISSSTNTDIPVSLNMRLYCGAYISANKISRALSGLSSAIQCCSNDAYHLGNAVSIAKDRFLQADHATLNQILIPEEGNELYSPDSISSASIDWNFQDLFNKILTSVGLFGETTHIIAEWFQNKRIEKTGAQSAACIAVWAKELVKYRKRRKWRKSVANKELIQEIFGLKSYAKEMNFRPSTIKNATKRYLRNLKKSNAFKAGMTNPANWIFEAVDKGFENYDEYQAGYKDAGTAIAEWATETTVGVAAAAGTVALIGAAIPAAPVVAVSILAGTAVWAIDTIWANTFGKGQDEDGGNEGLIEATGETLVAAGKFAVDVTLDTLQAAGGVLVDGWNMITQWAR